MRIPLLLRVHPRMRSAAVLMVCLLVMFNFPTSLAAARHDAIACQLSHGVVGNNTCLSVTVHDTTRTHVTQSEVTHYHAGIQICENKARFRGTLHNGDSYSLTSTQTSTCSLAPVVWNRIDPRRTFKDPSTFSGQNYHDGAWAPGVPAVRLHN